MGGSKPVKPCGYQRPHDQHVWEEDGKYGRKGRKLFCKGMPAAVHKHDWDHGQAVLQKNDGSKPKLGEVGSPVNGPYQCSCGMSRWLEDGRVATRFPHADPYDRIVALRAKLARGKEEWTEDDRKELEAIGNALVEAFTPLVDAFVKLAETVGAYVQSFIDKIDPATMALMMELTKAYGEKPDAVETVDIHVDGELVDTKVLGYDPVAAVSPTDLLSDEDQISVIQDAYETDDPQFELPTITGPIVVSVEPKAHRGEDYMPQELYERLQQAARETHNLGGGR